METAAPGAHPHESPVGLPGDAERRLRAMATAPVARAIDEPRVRAAVKAAIPTRAVDPARIALTRLLAPLARRRIAAALTRPAVRLHLGSGFEPKAGWIDIDRAPVRVDVPWDLRRGIPFPDASADAVFSEHLFEHLPLGAGLALMDEIARVLRPGGVVRTGVPDAGQVVGSWAGRADPGWARAAPSPMLAITTLFYEHGHRAMYDGETLALLCRAAGLIDARRVAADEGVLAGAVTPARAGGTLYVEAVAP